MFTMRLTSLPSLRIGLLNSDEIRRLRPKIGNDVTSFWSMEMSADRKVPHTGGSRASKHVTLSHAIYSIKNEIFPREP